MPELLHTRIRVGDMNRSIDFYTRVLGFQLAREPGSSPHGNQIAFLDLPGNKHGVELTFSENYDLEVPEDLMHFAIGYEDLTAFCEGLEADGIDIWPADWREQFRTGRKMAFIDDPDGYEIELLESR